MCACESHMALLLLLAWKVKLSLPTFCLPESGTHTPKESFTILTSSHLVLYQAPPREHSGTAMQHGYKTAFFNQPSFPYLSVDSEFVKTTRTAVGILSQPDRHHYFKWVSGCTKNTHALHTNTDGKMTGLNA